MRRAAQTLAAVVATAAAALVGAGPAIGAPPRTGHFSVPASEPFVVCGDLPVTYSEETDWRLVSRDGRPGGDWTFTMFTDGWYAFTSTLTGRSVRAVYHKADRDIRVLASDGESRTLLVMNNRTETWFDDQGNRLGAVHGPISFEVTVSYAGTPSDPLDDFWTVPPTDYRVRGTWTFDDAWCDAARTALS